MSYIKQYIQEAVSILDHVDQDQIEKMIQIILEVKQNRGRLSFLGVH